MAEPSSSPASGNTEPLNPGTLLQNRYAVEKLLGGGGMGMVYLAHDRRLSNRSCAIKEMIDHFIDPQQRLEANEYFAREADTLAQLKHPAIPAITDRFDDHNRHYLVMEYVEGRNLEEELAVQGGEPLSEGLVIDIARQLSEVLAYLHGFSPPMVYRDMKPANVMLTPKGKVVLIDFGIARLFKTARKGTMIGTLGFAPPEQYQGQVDTRSDIYSLGATLHYVLTARDPEKFPPFSFPPVQTLKPGISSNLASAIDAALGYKVEDRPQTIQEFRDMLLYGHGPITGGLRVSPKSGTAGLSQAALAGPAPVRRRRRARRSIGVAVFSMLLGVIAFGATYLYSNPVIQHQLGLTPLIDALPWKHEELVAKARQQPLQFEQLALNLSTRDGSPLSPPKTNFTDAEIASSRYMKWSAQFRTALAGIDGRTTDIEARFFDPDGLQITSSEMKRFVGPSEKTADFNAVVLMPSLDDRKRGQYRVGLYMEDQRLAEQAFTVTEDLAAKARAEAAKASAAATARAEEERKREEQKRLALVEERRAHPLELIDLKFINSTKTGTPLSGPADTFSAAKVLFVGWEVTFNNRLYRIESNPYRVEAAYYTPDGRPLGSVLDSKNVPESAKSIVFSGRVGNAAGGAFLPGVYSVSFYLNGQFFAQKKFRITSESGLSGGSVLDPGGAGMSSRPSATRLDMPVLASGRIDGLAGRNDIPLELRLRPQSGGFLRGELVIHEAGYGTSGIDGFIRGESLQFSAPYGSETLYFEGQRRSDQLSGVFQASPSRVHGTWNARAEN